MRRIVGIFALLFAIVALTICATPVHAVEDNAAPTAVINLTQADSALQDASAAYRRGDYAAALKGFRPLADRGDATAQTDLGGMYQFGQGVQQDYTEAVNWYRKAADQGYAIAQFNLGGMYQFGKGVPQDYAEALRWYHKAADQGNADAQNNLGVMYQFGQGVPQDHAEAMKWYRKAADQGFAKAQSNLAALSANQPTNEFNDAVNNYCKTATPQACAYFKGQAANCVRDASYSVGVYLQVANYRHAGFTPKQAVEMAIKNSFNSPSPTLMPQNIVDIAWAASNFMDIEDAKSNGAKNLPLESANKFSRIIVLPPCLLNAAEK